MPPLSGAILSPGFFSFHFLYYATNGRKAIVFLKKLGFELAVFDMGF